MHASTPPTPPSTRQVPAKASVHGIEWEDTFSWLRNKDDPEVIAHLERENAYTAAVLSKHADLEETIYHELVGRIEETNESAPYFEGNYEYKSKITTGADYRQYYRRQRSEDAQWELYFDAAREAAGHDYFDLAFLDVSPNGKLLAYAVDFEGNEIYSIRFRDLSTGKNLQWQIDGVSGEGEWDAANRHFFVVKEDASQRPFQIWRYRLGTAVEQMELVHEELDSTFYLELSKSHDGEYLFATSASKETTEVSYLSAHQHAESFTTIFNRRRDIQYFAEHHSGEWLIRCNQDAPDYKLLGCRVGAHDPDGCRVIVPAVEGTRLDDFWPFKEHIVLEEKASGLSRLRILTIATQEQHLIATSDPVYEISAGTNAEFNTKDFTYIYSSPIRPQQVIRYNMDDRTSSILKSIRIPSGHTPEDYEVYRIEVPISGGTAIPVTITRPVNFPMDGSGQLYLYGYGAYGSPVGSSFRSFLLSFLERGICVAVAHVRGGGLLGESWYQDGKLMHKHNSFDDFIAVARELIRTQYTRPSGLAIEGASAGGLLIGAVLNQCPDLFKVAVADVPFVDVLNTMLDPSLPLTTFEYEEWGNPNEKHVFDYIRSYCPYTNATGLPYPSILAIAGFNDPKVAYWEPAKWVARLRQHSTSNNPILLKTYFESGHGGASGRYGSLREIAFTQAFIISQLKD